MKNRDFDLEEEKEDDIYTEEGTDLLIEDDEISPEEAAFMEGYNST